MKHKLINWFFLLLTIVFVSNIIRTVANLSREDKIIQDSNDKLQTVTDENQNLKRQLAQVGSREFIEREARNKLNLGKEGEIVLILPSISPLVNPTPIPLDVSPNWQKWVEIFL